MSLFVDTSVWYAALDRSDSSHEIAKQLLGHAESLAVTDHIVIETHRLASYRLGAAVGDTFLQTILSGAANVEMVTLPDMERAASVRARYPDQSFSLVDCTSFVVMERLRLLRVATFDDDYAVYRYGADGRRAFTVVR